MKPQQRPTTSRNCAVVMPTVIKNINDNQFVNKNQVTQNAALVSETVPTTFPNQHSAVCSTNYYSVGVSNNIVLQCPNGSIQQMIVPSLPQSQQTQFQTFFNEHHPLPNSSTSSPMFPFNFPPPFLPSTSAIFNSQFVTGPIRTSPVLIAQPININLEVIPKIQLPTLPTTSFSISNANSTSSANTFSANVLPTTLRIAPIDKASSQQINGVNSNNKPFFHPAIPIFHQHAVTTPVCKIAPSSSSIEIDCWNTAVSGWEQATLIKNKIGLIINKRYKIVQSIASGSYGTIFVAEDMASPTRNRVAVKFDTACKDDHLKYEYDVYKSVLYDDGVEKVVGFPQVYWYGHEYGHNILAMELLGAPLASLFAFCDRKFGKQTIISLGEQMIHRIRHLHRRGFIHRDIKPENFLIGIGERENICYLIDFGLARRYRYRDNRELRHIPFRKNRSFVGTAKYASLNSHKSIELSRRDDLESLGYVLVELINGNLPWKNISKRNAITRHQTSIRIRCMKEQTNWAEVCPAMARFIKYCRELPFTQDPDYDYLLTIVREIVLTVNVASSNGTVRGIEKITPDNLQCEVCASKPMFKIPVITSAIPSVIVANPPPIATVLPTTSIPPSPAVIHPIVPIASPAAPPAALIDNQICTIPPQLPFALMQPVDECVASLRSLSLAAAAAAAAVSGGGPPANSNGVLKPAAEHPPTTNCLIGSSIAEEDDESTTVSCQKCRERLQLFFDQQLELREDEVSESENSASQAGDEDDHREGKSQQQPIAQLKKMSWQIWRESSLDRRFQYENRFSWTVQKSTTANSTSLNIAQRLGNNAPSAPLPPNASNSNQNVSNMSACRQGAADFSIPPPPCMAATDIAKKRKTNRDDASRHHRPHEAIPNTFHFTVPPPPLPLSDTVCKQTHQSSLVNPQPPIVVPPPLPSPFFHQTPHYVFKQNVNPVQPLPFLQPANSSVVVPAQPPHYRQPPVVEPPMVAGAFCAPPPIVRCTNRQF